MYRLKLELGLITATGDFLETANFHSQNQLGFPAEAKKVIDSGIDAGALSKDSSNEKYKKPWPQSTKSLQRKKGTCCQKHSIPNTSAGTLEQRLDLRSRANPNANLDMMAEGLKLP